MNLSYMSAVNTEFVVRFVVPVSYTHLAEKGGMGDTDLSALSDKISEMPGTITEQSAVRFVKDEYSSLGVDMNVLQQNYLLSAGGKMLLIALLMMAVSVTVGFFAATTAAKVGRDLRAGVFRNVVSFSSAEIDRFSTASLITRSTNDIQQIQMVIVMPVSYTHLAEREK